MRLTIMPITPRFSAIRMIFFPIYNTGALIFLGFVVALYILIFVLTKDFKLLFYMIVGSWLSATTISFIFGLFPAKLLIERSLRNDVVHLLSSEESLTKVSLEAWASKRHTSSMWRSDWITLSLCDEALCITGRWRDLLIISKRLKLR